MKHIGALLANANAKNAPNCTIDAPHGVCHIRHVDTKQKPIRVPVPLKPEVYAKLSEAAEKSGLALSAYLRMAALERADR